MSTDTEHVTSLERHDAEVGVDEFTSDEWETIRSERDRYLDALQRNRADFANYRKRAARDQAMAREHGRLSVLRSMLPLVDAVEQARDHDDAAGPLWAAALDAFQREDVERIAPTPGVAFDPTVHDAVSTDAGGSCTESAGNTIVASLLRTGYRIGDQLLRPAEVEVTTDRIANDNAPASGGDAVTGDHAGED